MRPTLLALALLLAPPVEAATRPPVAIVSPTVSCPPEMAGSGIAPAVGVELQVDARGRVTSVKILSIHPSSRFDALVRRAVRETLSDWRYAPALDDGRPVAARVTWEIQFKPREQEAAVDEPHSPWLGSTGIDAIEQDADRLSRYLSTLPPDLFDKTRAEHLDAAESQIVAERRQMVSTERFEVVTDMPEPGVARQLAGNLGAAYGAVRRLVAGKIAPQPERLPLRVYAYSSEAAFLRLAGKLEVDGRADAFYDPTGILALHLEVPSSEIALHALLHEATHAYLSRIVARRAASVPLWLGEGLAEYVANSDVVDGKLVPGSHKPYTLYHAPGLVRRDRSLSLISAAIVKDAIAAGGAVKVRDLVTARPARFYGARADLYYAQAWLLVHFLRHGEPSWADDEFPRFLLYVAEGFGADDALAAVYRRTWESLDAGYREYVKGF